MYSEIKNCKPGDVIELHSPGNLEPYVVTNVVNSIPEEEVYTKPLRRYIEEREFVEINGEFTNIWDYINSKMEIYLDEHKYGGSE